MALFNPPPPPAVTSAFARDIDAYLSPPPGTKARYVGPPPPIPSSTDVGGFPAFSNPYSQVVFLLGLKDVAANTGVSAAVPAGWRLFAGLVLNKTIFGRMAPRPVAGGWKLTAVYYGGRVWTALQESRALDSLPQIQANSYNLRVLAIPGLNLEAFWLVATNVGVSDLVIPFPVKPNQPIPPLNTEPVYPLPNFLAAIRPLAIQRMIVPKSHGS